MAMGRQEGDQPSMWVATQTLARSPGHAFYEKLNQVLEQSGFDRYVEELCAPHYAEQGRPSIPPRVYFRMLFIGYFEGLDSQRAIAWRCADSLSLRAFLRIELSEGTPDHSSMTNTRKRLPEEVFWAVFAFVLKMAAERGLLKGKTIAVDSTTLEANAAMKSLVRRATNEDWKTYVKRLMKAEGIASAAAASVGVRSRDTHAGAVRCRNAAKPAGSPRPSVPRAVVARVAASVAATSRIDVYQHIPPTGMAYTATRDGMAKWGFLNGLLAVQGLHHIAAEHRASGDT